MLNYEDFKEIAAEKIKKFISEKGLKGYMVDTYSIYKTNIHLDAISLIEENNGQERTISASAYFNYMYEDYKDGVSIEEIAENVGNALCDNHADVRDTLKTFDFKNAKESIIYRLVNTGMNKELLETLPHREFLDLSIVYCYLLNFGDRLGVCNITNDVASKLGFTEEDLYGFASKNTPMLLPERPLCAQRAGDMFMFAVTNQNEFHGAATMLYGDVFKEIASAFDTDLAILPSSVHEVMVCPYREDAIATYERTLLETNEDPNIVSKEEVLSNNVYHYCKETGAITFAH